MKIFFSLVLFVISFAAAAESTVNQAYTGSIITNNERLAIPQDIISALKNAQGVAPSTEDVNTSDPATGISYYQIVAVASSNSNNRWESISQWDSAAIMDQGVSVLKVATFTYGYGNVISANINGTSGTNYRRDAICGPVTDMHDCLNGETITGFIDYFSFDETSRFSL